MPKKIGEFDYTDYTDTIYPDGLEGVPPNYAISRRNMWMIDNADYVVTYVKYIVGGAARRGLKSFPKIKKKQ
ncbi:MAG: hypothetical protein UHH95_04500 [Oscillospiraceae bacterium]|nr:hypothetical protein [Oscillospiraceae bacterium]